MNATINTFLTLLRQCNIEVCSGNGPVVEFIIDGALITLSKDGSSASLLQGGLDTHGVKFRGGYYDSNETTKLIKMLSLILCSDTSTVREACLEMHASLANAYLSGVQDIYVPAGFGPVIRYGIPAANGTMILDVRTNGEGVSLVTTGNELGVITINDGFHAADQSKLILRLISVHFNSVC